MPHPERALQTSPYSDNAPVAAEQRRKQERINARLDGKPEPPADLWEQLDRIKSNAKPQRPPGSFTVNDYAARYKISRSSALRQLGALVDAEKLTCVQIVEGGTTKNFYIIKSNG